MDSLLREIDDEMENTGASEWKIPLQEIGDETMEMLVNHNAMENKYLQELSDPDGLRTLNHPPSSSSKKSVDFTEEIKLLEDTEEQERFRNRSQDDLLLQRSAYKFPVKERCTDEREVVGQSNDDPVDEDDEDKDEGLDPYPLSSKVPLANAVKINNFNLEAMTSRISSESSYIGSGSDLETSTINDKYKFLEFRSLDDDKAESTSPSSAGDPNPSGPYGFITDYESARESMDGSNSELVSQRLDNSGENLGASTSIRETSWADGGTQSLVSSHHDDMLIEEESYKSPDATVNNSEASYSFDEVRENSRNTIGHADSRGIIPPHISEMTEADAIIPRAEYSKLTEDPNTCAIRAAHLGISKDSSESRQGSNIDIEKGGSGSLPRLEKKAPNLPSLIPVIEPGPIFNEDPFEEVFDSSEDSLDLMRTVKPIDYISIWHSQADRFKSHSPAASAQSQFSERSFSSKSSVSVPHTGFPFVSRLVRRCRYYNPEKVQHFFLDSDDDDDDDDVIYMVNHTMDPRSRNSLISRQAKDNLKNNKKSNSLSFNAIGLRVENFGGPIKDNDSQFDTSPVTFSSMPDDSKTSREQILDIKRDESLIVKADNLERGLSTVTSESSHTPRFQDYEHFAPFISTPEVSHAEMPQSPVVERDGSMPYMSQNRGTESHPAFSPKYMGGKSPVVFPPADPSRKSNMPVLSPPPRDIGKGADSLTLAPAPKVRHLDKKMVIEGTPEINIERLLAKKHGEMRLEKEEPLEAELSPSSPHDNPINLIDNLKSDGQSIPRPSKTRRDGHSIWNEGYNIIEGSNRRNSMSPEVLDRLLRSEYGSNDATEQSRNSPSTRRYIKSPNDNVLIGRGLSESGLEAVISTEEVDERDSILFDEFHNGSICQTPTQSSVGKLHVKSPLKPANRSRSAKCEVENLHHKPEEDTKNKTPVLCSSKKTILRHNLEINGEGKNKSKLQISSPSSDEKDKKHAQAEQIQAASTKGKESSVSSEPLLLEEDEIRYCSLFPDSGTLYLRLRGVFGISLNGFKRRNAQFAIEIDNGQNIAQTPWKPMIEEGYIELNEEFEIVLSGNLDKQGRIVLTLKCRYEKQVYEPKVEEIIEKVSVGSKRKLFGKKKERYEYQKKIIPKPAKLDKWEYIFARDGSFGRHELVIDKDFLEQAKFQVKTMKLDLKNEWARQHGASDKKPYQLPRVAPYVIGELQLDVCYLRRTSVREKFPRSLSVAYGIMSKYESRQGIFKDGYLLQKGGDLHDEAAKRFFRLQGNKLIAYHEITGKAKIIINLLKVSDVVPPTGLNNTTLNKDPGGQNYFYLVFANKEIIAFDTEFSTEEKYDWYRKIDCVVDLNKSHQPWVKAFYEKSINNV